MSEVERRMAKLHKQPEVEDDDEDDDVSPDKAQGRFSENTTANPGSRPTGGISTPIVLSASSSETSPDDTQTKTVLPPPITRKQTLIRTQALEGTSPPPDSFFSQLRINGSSNHADSSNLGDQRGSSTSHEAKEFLLASHEHCVSNDSGRGTLDINDGGAETPSLSRTSSIENNGQALGLYKDSSGVDLIQFFKHTLQKSPKDRKTLFWLEKELHDFIGDESVQTKKLPEMNPYDRMLVHRLAAHMGIEHNVDHSGKSVIVGKTEITRIPDVSLADFLGEMECDAKGKKKILLKKPASLDEKQTRGSNRAHLGNTRAKSLEERQQIYSEVRERIFKNDANGAEEQSCPSLLTTPYGPGVIQQRSLDSIRPPLNTCKGNITFISADGGYGTNNAGLRGGCDWAHMTKSNSYGGMTSVPVANVPQGQLMVDPHRPCVIYTTSDSREAPDGTFSSPPPLLPTVTASDRTMTPQAGSDQSQPSPLTPPTAAAPSTSYAYLVSSDYSSIPVGSLIIDPQTMQPHVNADGSVYRFDPTNPPPFMSQQQAQPRPLPATPPTSFYPTDNGDPSNQYARPSVAMPLSPSDAYSVSIPTGQPLHMFPHPQYSSTPLQPHHYQQGTYIATARTPSQPTVRFLAITQGAGAVEGQGPATVPMPAVQTYAPVQLMGPHYQPVQVPGGPPTDDMSHGYPQDGITINVNGVQTLTARNPATPHIIQGYSVNPGFAHQPHIGPAHYHPVTYSPAMSSSSSFCTVPPSTSTPPLLTQPPPPPPPLPPHHPTPMSQHPHHPQQHHQQIQQPSATPTQHIYGVLPTAPTSTLTLSHSTSTPAVKSWAAASGVLHAAYRPPSPTQHNSAPGQPLPVTIGYLAPSQGAPQAPPQLVTFPAGPYPQRSIGTVIQLGPQSVPQGQSYVYRPFAPVQGANTLRAKGPSLHLSSPHCQPQQRPKLNSGGRLAKKGMKKASSSFDESQAQTVNIMTPLIPGLAGSPVGQQHLYLPPTTANRQ